MKKIVDFLICSGVLLGILAFIGVAAWFRAASPCSWWDLAPVKDVPARCLMHR